MAPNHLLLAAIVLLPFLAAVVVASTGDDQCQPGLAFPHNPLASCRTYVVSQACHRGPRLPMLVKERCCRELAAVPERCRCEALRILMDGVRAADGRVVEGRLEDLRDCPRENQRGFAATLLTAAKCNLRTISSDTRCYGLIDGGVPKQCEGSPTKKTFLCVD